MAKRTPRGWSTRRGPGMTAAVWFPMLLWFAAVRPGLMSTDSLTVWKQVLSGDWVDVHAPLYTAAGWLSFHAFHDPRALALGQSLLLAASLVAVARAGWRLRAPRPPWLWPAWPSR